MIKESSPFQLFVGNLEFGIPRARLFADALGGELHPVRQEFQLHHEMVRDMLVSG